MREDGKRRRSALAALLTVVIVVVATAGTYVGAALFARGLWVIGAVELLIWGGLLWVIGRARRAANSRKVRPLPAENVGK
jgi:hypothetical protein